MYSGVCNVQYSRWHVASTGETLVLERVCTPLNGSFEIVTDRDRSDGIDFFLLTTHTIAPPDFNLLRFIWKFRCIHESYVTY